MRPALRWGTYNSNSFGTNTCTYRVCDGKAFKSCNREKENTYKESEIKQNIDDAWKKKKMLKQIK